MLHGTVWRAHPTASSLHWLYTDTATGDEQHHTLSAASETVKDNKISLYIYQAYFSQLTACGVTIMASDSRL